ncbi:PAAR domain-containing protein [Aquimarina hainanensis]|uniref:PAAR domain-containing protein n=1 Tax=Aquimarina hainanensis TaxID=1578017 RepID=A0ABW5N8H2_9FLAO|nr:PAAR domain-containing protein [Aquimarina sp. TRL1]
MPGPVATQGSMHTCPMYSGTTPHVGGPIMQGEPNILVNNKPAATIGSMCACAGPPDTVAQGAPNVFFNGKPAACLGDMTAHGGVISSGEPNVLISSGSATPSVTMPKNKIPFPKISIMNRLLGNAKEAEENQKKLQEEKEEGDPRIYNLQWVKEREVIRKSKVLKEATLRAYVYNIPDGDTVTFTIKKPVSRINDNETASADEELITLSGTVQDKKVEVVWEFEDPTEEETSEE